MNESHLTHFLLWLNGRLDRDLAGEFARQIIIARTHGEHEKARALVGAAMQYAEGRAA